MRLRVLGQCVVELDDRTLIVRHKAAEMLGLLAVQRRAVTRVELASTLWPDAFDADARHNLRQTLFVLRNRLGAEASLIIDPAGASLSTEASVDLWERDAQWEGQPSLEDLKRWDEFLATHDADWVLAKRADDERRLVETALRRGDRLLGSAPHESLAFAHVAIKVAPDLETPRRLAVRAYLALDDRAGAVKEITGFETLLEKVFGGAVTDRLRDLLKPSPSFHLDEADLQEMSPGETLALIVAALPALSARPVVAQRILRDALEGTVDASQETRAQVEVALARLALSAGDVREAEAAALRAHDIATAPLAKARANAVRASVLYRTNRLGEAWSVLLAAREVAQRFAAVDLLAEIDGGIGACLVSEHRLGEAEEVLRRALPEAKRAGNKATIDRIVQNLAVAAMYAGRLDAAFAELDNYRPIVPPSCRASLAMNLGRVREAQGFREAAERDYADAVAALREQGEPFLLARALTYAADAALARGGLEEARRGYEEAVALRRTMGDRLGLMTAYKGLGTVSHREGKLRLAQEHLREALRFSIETGEPMAGASVRLALARVLEEAGRIDEALTEARRAKRGILGLRAVPTSLTTDDTLSLEAVDALVKRLETAKTNPSLSSIPVTLPEL